MEERPISSPEKWMSKTKSNDKIEIADKQVTKNQEIKDKEAFEMKVLIKEETSKRIELGSEYEMDCTAGDIYDALHEQIALARTRALMGEWCQAQSLFEQARDEYALYKTVLKGLPLHALEHAFTETMQILSAERNPQSETLAALITSQSVETQKPRTRKRASRAA